MYVSAYVPYYLLRDDKIGKENTDTPVYVPDFAE